MIPQPTTYPLPAAPCYIPSLPETIAARLAAQRAAAVAPHLPSQAPGLPLRPCWLRLIQAPQTLTAPTDAR